MYFGVILTLLNKNKIFNLPKVTYFSFFFLKTYLNINNNEQLRKILFQKKK